MEALKRAVARAEAAGISFDWVDTPNLKIHYAHAGPADAQPLILLHGWPEFCLVWQPVMERLHHEFRLIAPDLRGFGDTGKARSGLDPTATADTHASDVMALVKALQVERFGLVSGDVGAYVAQALAHKYPERLHGMVFFCTPYPGIGPRYGAPDHLIEVWYQYFNQLPWAAELVGSSREACRIFISHFLNHWSGDNPEVFRRVLEVYVDNFMKPGNVQGGFDWYVSSAKNRRLWLEERLPRPPMIDVRSRLLWGKRDPLIKSEWSDQLPEYFSNYTIDFVDAGHFVHFECPDRAASEIEDFFKAGLGDD